MSFIIKEVNGMKVKKHTIIFTGILIIISIMCFTFLQFRLYHWFHIYGNENQFLSNLRNFFLITTSGIFTSSCVTFTISIREYLDEKEVALRNLLRLAGCVKEKYKEIKYITHEIPEKIIIPYLIYKHENEMYVNKFSKFDTYNPYLEYIDEKRKILYEYIWNITPKLAQEQYYTEEKKNKYLEKQCLSIEKDYIQSLDIFVKSLQVFNDFNTYQVDEALDMLCFFFDKKNKIKLEKELRPILIITVEVIKSNYKSVLCSKDKYKASLETLYILNPSFIEYSNDRKEAYLIPELVIDVGRFTIKKILNPWSDIKKAKIEDYKINTFPRMNLDEEIIFSK